MLAAAAVWGMTSCSGGGGDAVPDGATGDPSLLPYRAAYRVNCATCHGRSGAGAAKLYPPLAGSPIADGDPALPIRVVLQGLEGKITVLGGVYSNKMPPLGERLRDEQIAGILSYVRASWGNRGGPVSAEAVAAVRAATAGRERPWTPAELDSLAR
jgi:mono/diheme cytochrome c family protein